MSTKSPELECQSPSWRRQKKAPKDRLAKHTGLHPPDPQWSRSTEMGLRFLFFLEGLPVVAKVLVFLVWCGSKERDRKEGTISWSTRSRTRVGDPCRPRFPLCIKTFRFQGGAVCRCRSSHKPLQSHFPGRRGQQRRHGRRAQRGKCGGGCAIQCNSPEQRGAPRRAWAFDFPFLVL